MRAAWEGERDASSAETVRPSAPEQPAAAAGSVSSARLVIVHSPGAVAGSSLELPEKGLLLGRGVPCDVILEDPRVSRVHACVRRHPHTGQVLITDRQSTNGTFVSGARVGECALEDGTAIRVGDTLLICQLNDPMRLLHEEVAHIAPTNLTVLLSGETGAGKDHVAGRIHEMSGRRGLFVAVNCASLPRDLVATELFGHTQGAFSGAKERREGLFVAAEAGTLFLDEIGDLSEEAQPVLLRALEEHKVRAVGSVREFQVDVRVIAATHVDLDGAVAQGRFRADLRARLNSGSRLYIPPLRVRRTEIPALITSLATSLGISVSVTVDALEAMLVWPWPYNVRELKRAIHLFGSLADRAALDVDFVRRHVTNERGAGEAGAASVRPPPITPVPRYSSTVPPPAFPQTPAVRRRRGGGLNLDPTRIRKELEAAAGNVTAAAVALGTVRRHLYRCLRKHEIDVEEFRRDR